MSNVTVTALGIKSDNVFAKRPKSRMRIMRSLSLSEWRDMNAICFRSGECKNIVRRFLHDLAKDGKVEKKDIIKSDHGYARKIMCYRWTPNGCDDFVRVQYSKYFALLKQWHPTFTHDHMVVNMMEVKSQKWRKMDSSLLE
jgi:predicted ArsR family transcriptional regulator